MPKLSALYTHPIKSCAALQVNALRIGRRGPDEDRMFMITDEHYVFRTQRKEQGGFAKMARIFCWFVRHAGRQVLTLSDGSMSMCRVVVQTSSEAPVRATVHGDLCEAIDQGEQPAAWISNFLGVPCRLVRMTDAFYRRVDPQFLFTEDPVQTGFADAYSVLIISDASLADLNERLLKYEKAPVCRENFRSCLWVNGCKPYEEDGWRRIRINGVVFDVVKPCKRCSITQVDVRRGVYREDKEPLLTLGTYRHRTIERTGKSGVMFGQNLVHHGTGLLRVGDEVEILERV